MIFVSFLKSHELLPDLQYGFKHSFHWLFSFLSEHISNVLYKQGETHSAALYIP